MPTKFNRWGKPQNYDPSTGRFGAGDGDSKVNIQLFGKQRGKGIDKQTDKEYNGNSNVKKPPKATGYNRPKTKHHNRHAQDMGLNEKEYIQAAIDFFNGRDGDMYYSQKRKKYYKYDSRKKMICVCGEDGTISTFMPFSNKEFERTFKRDVLIEV